MNSNSASNGGVRVTLRFVGDSVDPQLLTSKLGIQPSEAHTKGELSHKRSGYVYSTGYWGIDSPYAFDRPIEEHLEHLLDLLEPKISILKQFEQMGLSPNFYCGFFATEDELSTFIKLESTLLERLVRIGASLDLHLYCCDEEDS